MKRTIVVFAILFCNLAVFSAKSPGSKLIWGIGKADKSAKEFALAPGGFKKFIEHDFGFEDKFFLVGYSNEKNDFPYVIPGPVDTWGGTYFPDSINAVVQPVYRYRSDGKPGREVILNFKGSKFSGKGTIQIESSEVREITPIESKEGIGDFSVLLPAGIGIESNTKVKVILKSANHETSTSVLVPKNRLWTVYIYPHSHVDIGYTNTQANVEIIHKRNLVNGMKLAQATVNYPEGARYIWNPEVIWPVERYLKNATPEEKEEVLDAIRKGFVHLDAGYINDNTSVTADEEFPSLFGDAKRLEKLTGVAVNTIVQVDIPGMSWGLVPMAAQFGIRYAFVPFNGSDRTGLSDQLSFRPFWWIGPDGISKILFLQPGDYTPGARIKGDKYWPTMAGQKDPAKLLQIVKTDSPREKFIDSYLWPKLKQLENDREYPYDIFPMTWAMADNTPIDADLPEAVKSWNEEYAFPRLVIASSTDIMSAFEKKYGDIIPSLRGDFTEYWTDGLGSAAKETSMNRHSKERLIQADILWSMLHPGEKAPRTELNEAWRNVLMGSEHTWCYMNPNQADMQNEIWKVKQGFFRTAEENSIRLLSNSLHPFIVENSKNISVFNTLSWKRSGIVTLSKEQREGFTSVSDANGNSIASQQLTTGEFVFQASDIPAFGSKIFVLGTKPTQPIGVNIARGNSLNNGIIQVQVDPVSGDIISIKDKAGYEFANLNDACKINSFRYLLGNGKPASPGPQYATSPTATEDAGQSAPQIATGPTEVKIHIGENGPLVASLIIESKADGCRSLIREVRLATGSPIVEIDNLIDKIATTTKEGIHFGFAFNIPDGRTRMDIPWGVVEIEADQLSAANRNWICFQRWLDISNDERGITWCSLDAPTFESGGMTANILGGAIHSPEWIQHLPMSSTIYSWALNNHWHTNFPLSQEGKINFRYRMWPHQHAYDPVKANRFGLEQARPLIAAPVTEEPNVQSPVMIENEKIFVSIVKTSGDGKSMIIRLRSVSDRAETVMLTFPSGKVKTVRRCVADEFPGEELGKVIKMRPYEITSLIVE